MKASVPTTRMAITIDEYLKLNDFRHGGCMSVPLTENTSGACYNSRSGC